MKIVQGLKEIVKKLTGALIYALTNSMDFRYVFPVHFVSHNIELLRVAALRFRGAEIGEDSFVRCKLFITDPKYLKIGAHSKIGIKSELFLYDDFQIGDNVEIGSGLIAHTAEHILSDRNLPLCKQGSTYNKIIIGSNVYIGSRTTILQGVKIEDYVVVGAGAVVTGDLKSGYMYAGVPARPIRKLE